MLPWLQQWRKIRTSFSAHAPGAQAGVGSQSFATLGLGFLTLGGALLPATQAWVGKLIVDGVVASIQGAQDAEHVRSVFYYLVLESILFLLSAAINHSRRLIQQLSSAPTRE